MSSVTLLGPQFRAPNLHLALEQQGLAGPFVSISAGWQEREGELDELRAHVNAEVHDLRIYERTERLFADDVELRRAHRQRQAQLQEMQELYQTQLAHAKDCAHELFAREEDSPALRRARRAAIATLRRLDRSHLLAIRAVHQRFANTVDLAARASVAAAVAQVARYVAQANAVFIAGGHVAVLVNRLRLLGGAALFGAKPVVAWSAGAMALADAVVLFHDSPPQGRANAEVFDAGFGLVQDAIVLPHAAQRLHLSDAARVRIMARRFAPSRCIALDEAAILRFADARLQRAQAARRLARDGRVVALES